MPIRMSARQLLWAAVTERVGQGLLTVKLVGKLSTRRVQRPGRGR